MKIKKDIEIASSIIVKTLRGERIYWTGSEWVDDMDDAKNYLREEAERRAKKKHAFVITTGFHSH